MKKKRKNGELSHQNEVKKLKLTAEYEAKFYEGGTKVLPANVESQWLDYIMAFEEASQKRETKKIHDLIENPKLPLESSLTDEEIPKALDEVFKILSDHDIALDVSHETSDREIYRFITEELIQQEMDIINVPGMVHHFIYEEFHPNHKEDLKRYTEDFVEALLLKKFKYMHMGLASECTFEKAPMTAEAFVKQLIRIVEPLESLNLNKFTIQSVSIQEEKATVDFQLIYETMVSNEDPIEQSEEGQCHFIYEDVGYWYVNGLTLPGLDITQ